MALLLPVLSCKVMERPVTSWTPRSVMPCHARVLHLHEVSNQSCDIHLPIGAQEISLRVPRIRLLCHKSHQKRKDIRVKLFDEEDERDISD
ncbi:hypothetical protein EYF80_020763 [Liparis tanakae]|uniref:Uncharacterized protein n=1 Tax=Liparis tanakae TaxID=230148 RepID=A0A4Z2HTS8_9TELE|nr:hypothetical protein EYF80_020763 [Liparis tanakae]